MQAFGEVAPLAFEGLTQLLSSKQSTKKKSDEEKYAWDNAVAALFMLLVHQSQHCKDKKSGWELLLSKLPLKSDEEEMRKITKKLLDLVNQQNQDVLGPNNANLPKLLGVFSEVYKTDSSEKETDDAIKAAFSEVPQTMLQSLQSQFTEKQQKRIMKILTPDS